MVERLSEVVGKVFPPAIGSCRNFKESDEAFERRVTVIVAPIKAEERNGYLRIVWQCNFGKGCFQRACVYAFGFREE